MLKTRERKIIGDILSRKGRTALVSLAIFVGVLGTIALLSLGDILIGQLREDIKEDELTMLDIFVTVTTGSELDDDAYLMALGDVEGVTDVMGAVTNIVQFKLTEDEDEFTDGFVNGFSEPFEDGLSIEPMRLQEGAYPAAGMNEVVIEQRTAENHGLSVGDELFFRILSPSRDEALDGAVGTLESWTITGIVFHPYAGAGNNGGFTVDPKEAVYANLDDANYIGGSSGFNLFRARFDDFESAEENNEAFGAVIANDTPYIPFFTQEQDPAENQLIEGARTLTIIMSIIAIVALVVSGFLVINVISSIVVEQKRQIGVMKSLGASRLDNFIIYAGIAFSYGFIAVVPGVALGIPVGNAIAHALAPQFNTVLVGFQVSISAVIVGIILGLLVPVLAAIVPVFLGTRVTILEAITDLGIDADYGTGPLARLIGLIPVPITVRQGLSNVALKKGRMSLTVVTLSIAAGASMGIFAVFSSLTDGLDLFLDTFNVEIGIFPTEARDPDEINTLLETNFRSEDNFLFESIEPGFQLQVEFDGYEPIANTGGPPGIFAYGFDIESEMPAFNLTVDEGDNLTAENADNGIVLSSLLATNMEVELGDTVTLKVPGNRADFEIIGISEFPLEQVWMDWRSLALVSGYTIGAPIPNEYITTVTADGYDGTLPDGQVGVVGLNTLVADFIPFTEGEFFTVGEPGVIISRAMAENGGYSVGDMLALTPLIEDRPSAEYPITGIFDLPPDLQRDDFPNDAVGMFWQDLAALEGISLEGKPLPQGYFVVTNIGEPTADQVDDIIDDMNEVMLDSGVSTVNFNFVKLVDEINRGFVTIQAILQIVAGLIALIGALGLLTTLSMSVFERQKEIGVMRSIGASSRTIASQFLTEGLVVGIIAWLVGLPIGYGINVLMLTATGLDEIFPVVYPVSAAIIGLVSVMSITVVASLWPSLAAARRPVADILRYQ